jgi:hypothetical protein
VNAWSGPPSRRHRTSRNRYGGAPTGFRVVNDHDVLVVEVHVRLGDRSPGRVDQLDDVRPARAYYVLAPTPNLTAPLLDWRGTLAGTYRSELIATLEQRGYANALKRTHPLALRPDGGLSFALVQAVHSLTDREGNDPRSGRCTESVRPVLERYRTSEHHRSTTRRKRRHHSVPRANPAGARHRTVQRQRGYIDGRSDGAVPRTSLGTATDGMPSDLTDTDAAHRSTAPDRPPTYDGLNRGSRHAA